jgi:magnesium-transporting ATPase (P-type)
MDRLLRALLLLVAIFLALLLLDMINFPYLPDQVEALYRETASVLFSIAPSGLFFMIIVTYALGSSRLGDTGAQVRDSRAVESLAQVSVLCFSKTGALTGAKVQLEMATPANGRPLLAESRVRQLLGDLAHRAHGENVFLQAIAESFAGRRRAITEEAWFLSVYGWSAVTFAEADVPGTYIIGQEAVLQSHLHEEAPAAANGEGTGETPSIWRERIADLGRLFQRQEADEPTPVPSESEQPDDEPAEEGITLFQRLRDQWDGLRPLATEVEPVTVQPQLLFVYSPEPRPLYDPAGQPQLPDDLIPLATLSFAEQLRPEAAETVSAFTESGVRVALLSSDDPASALEAARQLGFSTGGTASANVIAGRDLALMTEEQVDALVRKSDIFAELTPEQKGNLVAMLRRQGERVAMVGDALGDVPAMQQANLGITLQSSSQAALNLADIVLLKDSLQVAAGYSAARPADREWFIGYSKS